MNLYQLSERYNEIADLAFSESDDEGQIHESFVRLMSICEDNITTKLGAMCRIIRELEATEEAARAEARRLSEKRGRAESHIARIKGYINESLVILGTKKLKVDNLFTVAIQNNPPALKVDDFDAVPHEFDKPPVRQLDNAKIKEAIKLGIPVPGCSIEVGTHVRIR